ncbi:MMPL family transporter [Flavobacteriales bacterium]|nr:MMPL family transporter [Flavobacteriales bacterium]
MIAFIWKYKYVLFVFIVLVFILSITQLRNTNIYSESERILKYAKDVELDYSKSNNEKNLFLVGLEYPDSISFDEFLSLNTLQGQLEGNEFVKKVRSIFNDERVNNSGLIPISNKILNLKNRIGYEKSLERIMKNKSTYLSSDFRKILFLVETNDSLNHQQNQEFIEILKNSFEDSSKKVYVSGQTRNELYIQSKVKEELLFVTLLSTLLCCLVLWFFTSNFRFVVLTLLSVLISVTISFFVSHLLFGGIELVMIIMPAIIFIVCISDMMHLLNNKFNPNKKKKYFVNQIRKVGNPVALTSFTTSIGFLSFCFSDVLPILRFGIVTTIGIFVSLFIVLIFYAICVDKIEKIGTLNSKRDEKLNDFLYRIIHLKYNWKHTVLLIIMTGLATFGVCNFEVNNYATDELNKKSVVYKEMQFFNDDFGGYKPIVFNIKDNEDIDIDKIIQLEKYIVSQDFFLNFSINGMFQNPNKISKSLYKKHTKDGYRIKSRMKDIGSNKSLVKVNKIKNKAEELNLNLKVGGRGYLFDQVSNTLTYEIIFGLFIAILIIGLLFLILNDFNFRYFFIALIPNIFPILVCIGIMSFTGFYFSLSNAFIFAIIFGLIVDDSIHILSSFRFNMKRGLSKLESINESLSITARAVLKTTIIVIVSLLPLLISDFKSVYQLSLLTIISAILALIFDLIYLPMIIRKYL